MVRDAFGQGRICYEHAVALCEVAAADTEVELVELACRTTASDFRRLSLSLKPVSDLDARQAMQQRSLTYSWDSDHRFLHLHGKLPDLDGPVVAKALDALTDRAGPDPFSGQYSSLAQSSADALVQLCSAYLDAEGDQDRATVVVHLDARCSAAAPG